jgi:hypothetical protein
MENNLEERTEKSSKFRNIVNGVGRVLVRIYDSVYDFISPSEPIVEIHRTHYERQVEHSSKVRRELIESGFNPDYADYGSRRRAGLTR